MEKCFNLQPALLYRGAAAPSNHFWAPDGPLASALAALPPSVNPPTKFLNIAGLYKVVVPIIMFDVCWTTRKNVTEIENHNFQGHIHCHFPWGNPRQSTNNQNSHLLGLTFAMSSSSKRRRSRSRSCAKSFSDLYFSINLNTQKAMTTQQKQAPQNSNPNPNPKVLLRQNNNTLCSFAESPCIWSKNLAKEVHFDTERQRQI